jgi:hypothetical protein
VVLGGAELQTADPNRPHCTPDLICRLGSADTSSSNPAMLPPLFSSPPRRFGNARCTALFCTRRCIWLSTRSRCSSLPSESSRQNAGSLIISRASRRVSAQVPSSRSPTASTSMRVVVSSELLSALFAAFVRRAASTMRILS